MESSPGCDPSAATRDPSVTKFVERNPSSDGFGDALQPYSMMPSSRQLPASCKHCHSRCREKPGAAAEGNEQRSF